MGVSVVIPVYNGEKWLPACIASVRNQTRAVNSIVAVDDDSWDASAELLASEKSGIQIIRHSHNRGYAASVNDGITAITAEHPRDHVLLLNQDAALEPDCIAMLIEAANRPNAGVIGCRLSYPDGGLQHAGGYVDRNTAAARHLTDDGADPRPGRPAVEFVTGAVALLTRPLIDAIGLLDATLSRAYYEDVDYCFRARDAGFEVIYEARARATHAEGSAIERHSARQYENYHSARIGFALKHFTQHELDALFAHEARAIEGGLSSDELRALMLAYGRNAALAASRLNSRRDPPHNADVKKVEERLRALKTLARRRTGEAARNLPARYERMRLSEFVFASRLPFVGWFRSAIHAVAGKWALRHVIDQQHAYNQVLAEVIADQARRIDALETRLEELEGLSAQSSSDPTAIQSRSQRTS